MVLIAAIIGAVAVIIAALLAKQTKKLNEIHVLVNSRLTDALKEIKELKDHLAIAREEPPDSERQDMQ